MEIKNIILIFIFIGLLLIITNLYKQNNVCPDQQIIYKYIPRTFEEENDEPVYPSDIFKTMFTQQSPWVRSVQGSDAKKKEVINQYFVSQQ